ncbi:unnamed protein product [Timema podura]|uniref:Alcohol dehydrogenase n=1 Tax=Timema podura TaxID=61482 RepID=A0ABN7NRJ0_TIMPD|nr:unnamed protein product [Timema podura]
MEAFKKVHIGAIRLPDNVSMEEGALLEPLSVGVHACRRAGVSLGSTVLITGAGPIGLVSLITAKAMGASTILITELTAGESTKSGGVIVIVGMGSAEVNIPLTEALVREIDIRGCFRYCNDYPIALAMIASGKVNVKELITHNFKIEETLEAFEVARSGKGNPIKVMIHCRK